MDLSSLTVLGGRSWPLCSAWFRLVLAARPVSGVGGWAVGHAGHRRWITGCTGVLLLVRWLRGQVWIVSWLRRAMNLLTPLGMQPVSNLTSAGNAGVAHDIGPGVTVANRATAPRAPRTSRSERARGRLTGYGRLNPRTGAWLPQAALHRYSLRPSAMDPRFQPGLPDPPPVPGTPRRHRPADSLRFIMSLALDDNDRNAPSRTRS